MNHPTRVSSPLVAAFQHLSPPISNFYNLTTLFQESRTHLLHCVLVQLEQENERLRLEADDAKQRAEQAALSLEKLSQLEAEMQVLRQPWWKKWFLPRPE